MRLITLSMRFLNFYKRIKFIFKLKFYLKIVYFIDVIYKEAYARVSRMRKQFSNVILKNGLN